MNVQVLEGSKFIGTNLIDELITDSHVINQDKQHSSKSQSLSQICNIADTGFVPPYSLNDAFLQQLIVKSIVNDKQ